VNLKKVSDSEVIETDSRRPNTPKYRDGAHMHGTTAPIASIAMAFLCVGIVSCGTQAARAYRTSSLNTNLPQGRVCPVSNQSCLSMMAEPPRPCLITMEHCAANGRLLTLDLTEKAY
jgi:hypothetical protein